MATATGWTDYAILEPSKPAFNKRGEPVKWKVQRNEAGDWRCHCPSFIFSGKGGQVRTCKHTRFCQSAWQLEQGIALTTPMPTGVPSHVVKAMATLPVTATISPVVPPLLADAKQIFAAMVAAAQIKAKHNLLDHIGRDTCQHMTEALRLKLVSFNPEAAAVAARMTARATAAATTVGVRHIQFDDD